MKTKNVTEKNMKVCLVGSSGGHLTHLYMLKPFWKDKNRFWVTFDKEDARSLLEGEKVYPCYFPTNRSIKALIKNTKIAWDVLHKEKPDLIISCGAAVAVPFFYIGKMMGAKLVYIEVFDRIDKPTMTGKMVYPIVDKFVVQWEEQKKVYPKAVNLGSMENISRIKEKCVGCKSCEQSCPKHCISMVENKEGFWYTFYKSIDEPGFIENIKVGFQPKARLKSVLPNKLI